MVQFFLVAGMGVVVGLVGANFMYMIHRYLPTTAAIDAALTVMTPYLLFLLAEQFHFSGVMAVVSGGLYMSYRSHEVFQNGSTRLNMLGVWTTMIFVMNALVFILIGLELPEIIQGLGEYSVIQAVKYSLWVSVLVILLRFLWVYPAAHLPRWISRKVRKEPSPGWKGPLVISWAGMRGVVSLATALSIPLYLTDGVAFPQRNLILFITFGVILVTLVFQGLTLPFILRIIHLEEIDALVPAEIQRAGIQKHLNQIALAELKGIEGNDWLNIYKAKLEREEQPQPLSVKKREEFHAVLLKIYSLQRKELFKLRRENAFSDEEIRRAELQLDLDEMSITGAEH